MPAEKIEAGDEVLHRPSGQKWAILGVDSERGYILAMGWPFQLEKLADCELAPGRQGQAQEARRRRGAAHAQGEVRPALRR
jgi:hypothetical protein